MTRLRFLAAGGLLAAVVGCSGGPKFAPVSGVVTLDGKPYAKAVVSFQPIGTADNPNPGRGSSAYTDENGRFVLKSDDEPRRGGRRQAPRPHHDPRERRGRPEPGGRVARRDPAEAGRWTRSRPSGTR